MKLRTGAAREPAWAAPPAVPAPGNNQITTTEKVLLDNQVFSVESEP